MVTRGPGRQPARRPGPRHEPAIAGTVPKLGDHPRSPHRPPPRVRQLADIDSPGDGGISVAQQERDLIHALTRQERTTGHRMPEAMYRRQLTVSDWHGLGALISLMQDRERRGSIGVDRVALRASKGSTHVALPERPTRARNENVVAGPIERRRKLVPDEHCRKLPRNRNSPRGSVCLGWSALPVPVDLPGELDLGVVDVIEPNVRPRQSPVGRRAGAVVVRAERSWVDRRSAGVLPL